MNVQVAIISAIDVEYKSVISLMSGTTTKYNDYTIGKINNICCVATQSGVGVLAVQRSVYDIMKYFKPKLLIFTGIAGSRNPNIMVGSVVVSGFICARNSIFFSSDINNTNFLSQYHAVQFKKNGTYINMSIIPGYKYLCSLAKSYGAIIGIQGTSDNYTKSKNWIDAFNHVYHTDTGDNESIGLAYAAETFSIPFIVIRGISDSVYYPTSESFIEGAIAAANLLKKILSNISFNFSLERITLNDLSDISLGIIYQNIITNNVQMSAPNYIGTN